MEYALLLDSPRQAKKRIQIAKLGEDFEHGKYGKFAITPDDVATWKANLAQLPGARALIDLDHQADRQPRNTEAAGWITNVDLDGDTPMADVEWTPKGKQAIEDGSYLFISPTYGEWKDENGGVHENTLIGAALTNRPFLNMPSLCLASEERVSEAVDSDPATRFHVRALDGEYGEPTRALVTLDISAQDRRDAASQGHALPDGSYPMRNAGELHAAAVLAASGHGDVQAAKKLIRRRAKDLGVDIATLPGFSAESADSRRTMSKALLTTLGLPEDANEQTMLDAVTALQAKATEPTEPAASEPVKTLEQQAAENGKVLLDADQVRTLSAQAAAGEAAMKQLHEQRFETAFTLALEDPKGARVTPSEKDSLKHFYTLDADATITMIEAREAIVPTKPQGPASIDLTKLDSADPQQIMAAGLHPESHGLHAQIKRHMLENKVPDNDYAKVLDQVMSGAVKL